MEEFVKLTWRKNVTDEDLQDFFLSEEAVAESYVYKNLIHPIKGKPKRNVKLHVVNTKHVPGLQTYRLIPRRSLLTKGQKAQCLEALKVIQSGKNHDLLTKREQFCLCVYNNCQQKIVEENRLFQEHIKNVWLKPNRKTLKVKPGIYNYAWPKWKRALSRYLEYPQYYREVCTLSLNYGENEATVDFQHTSQPLETGSLARFAQPNLKEPCILKFNTLKKVAETVRVNSKLPVSQDDNVTEMLKNHNFDVVISSSGLKQIIDYTNTKSKWILPVVVKEISIDKGGSTIIKKIVFVDKLLPKVNPNPHDLNYYTYKRLLKLNFCQYEAFRYPFEETPIEALADNKEDTDECEQNDAEKDEPKVEKKLQEKDRVVHHNVSYRIWNVKATTTQNTLMKNLVKDREINLLVRCKLDACEDTEQGVLYPVVVRPKIEQQFQYGANIPSKSELARDWAALFFRIYSSLYRARIYTLTNEIVAVEKCLLQKINSEAHTHYDYKPILGLGVLQKILSRLVDLECGSYLLQHLPKDESFVSVMKQCDDAENAYDLYAECEDTKVDTETRQNWLPVDVNYILPVHEEHNQIPAVFHGFDNKPQIGEKKAFNKTKKRAKKKKKQT